MNREHRCVMTTYTGREVNPLALHEQDVCLKDVAHALALTNRFGGHTRFPISVAQHSVYVSWLLSGYGHDAMWYGLLHDIGEYLLGDMPKWVKHQPEFEFFRTLEDNVTATALRSLGIVDVQGLEGHLTWADDLMVRFEADAAYDNFVFDDKVRYPALTSDERDNVNECGIPHVTCWMPWSWEYAETMFLMRAQQLVPGSVTL